MRQRLIDVAEQLKGYTSVEDVQKSLKVNRARAIYLIYKLRKHGFVKGMGTSYGKRRYYIAFRNAIGGSSYLEVLNKYAPVPLASFQIHKIYGKTISVEETLIYALKSRDIRHIIACLALFRKIRDWHLLYRLAKKENLVREVAALYDVSRLVVSKVRRMPKRFKNLATPKKSDKYKHIIKPFSSLHFKDIEKKWKVYIPLNLGDVAEYRGFMT